MSETNRTYQENGFVHPKAGHLFTENNLLLYSVTLTRVPRRKKKHFKPAITNPRHMETVSVV